MEAERELQSHTEPPQNDEELEDTKTCLTHHIPAAFKGFATMQHAVVIYDCHLADFKSHKMTETDVGEESEGGGCDEMCLSVKEIDDYVGRECCVYTFMSYLTAGTEKEQ